MYYLEFEYEGKIISIPFGKLKDIDKYTIKYGDRLSLLNKLNSILELGIDINYVKAMYLVKEKNRYCEFDYDNCLPIRYNGDNYNIDSLRDNFISYLQKDHNRIREFDVIHVELPFMIDFKNGKRDISDNEIKLAVNAYFKNNYNGIRKIYFDIKNECKIKNDSFRLSNKVIERDGLSKLENDKDDYLQYLIELSSRSEEDRLRAISELSLMDMEELVVKLSNKTYGVLDGLSDVDAIRNGEILEFETLVGMDVKTIRSFALETLGRRK